MTLWTWVFAGLLVGLFTKYFMDRQNHSRFLKNLEAKVVAAEKALEEHRVHYNAVYAQTNALLAFVQEFVFQNSVTDVLQKQAENLDFACKRSVATQQNIPEDPDRIQEWLATIAKEIAVAKKRFWNLVEIVEKANQVLGGIRQFSVPKSYKQLLKNSVVS